MGLFFLIIVLVGIGVAVALVARRAPPVAENRPSRDTDSPTAWTTPSAGDGRSDADNGCAEDGGGDSGGGSGGESGGCDGGGGGD